jgi:hypothetical protein
MPPDAKASAVEAAVARLLRDTAGLPSLALS